MSGLEPWLPGHDGLSGTYMLLVWAAAAVAVLVVVLGALAFRDEGMRGTLTVLLRGAGVLVFAALAWAWLELSSVREWAAERRALQARAAELAAQALSPGGALACLNGTGNEVVDAACVQAVFASPQAVAAAVAYVDARLKLLADGLEFARRDRNYASELEGLRRSLEADRFGVVAHVLGTRGCTAEKCAAFALLRDASKVRANLSDRFFDAHIASHSPNWRPESATASAAANAPALLAAPVTSALPGAPPSKYSFPSAASIPPISIMNAEPTGATPPASGQGASNAAPPPPAAAESQPPARRQSATRPAPQRQLPPPPRQAPPAAAPSQ